MIVYNPDGVAENKEPCDARECVDLCGYSFKPKEEQNVVEAPKAAEVEAPKRGRPSKQDYEPTAATLSTVTTEI